MVLRERCAQTVLDTVKNYEKRTSAFKSCHYCKPVLICYILCRCKKCKGKKTVKEKTRQEIFIERGMANRQRIVLSGAGDEEVQQFLIYVAVNPRLITIIIHSPAYLRATSSSNSKHALTQLLNARATTFLRKCTSHSQKHCLDSLG